MAEDAWQLDSAPLDDIEETVRVWMSVMPPIFRRIAAVVSLLFAIGPSLGGLKDWSPMGDNDVLKVMATVRFDVMGASRSYLDFFTGFGWSLSVSLLLQSAPLWQMASPARSNAAQVRAMTAMFAVATLASGAIAWHLILPLPALFSVALLILSIAAFITAKQAQS